MPSAAVRSSLKLTLYTLPPVTLGLAKGAHTLRKAEWDRKRKQTDEQRDRTDTAISLSISLEQTCKYVNCHTHEHKVKWFTLCLLCALKVNSERLFFPLPFWVHFSAHSCRKLHINRRSQLLCDPYLNLVCVTLRLIETRKCVCVCVCV